MPLRQFQLRWKGSNCNICSEVIFNLLILNESSKEMRWKRNPIKTLSLPLSVWSLFKAGSAFYRTKDSQLLPRLMLQDLFRSTYFCRSKIIHKQHKSKPTFILFRSPWTKFAITRNLIHSGCKRNLESESQSAVANPSDFKGTLVFNRQPLARAKCF